MLLGSNFKHLYLKLLQINSYISSELIYPIPGLVFLNNKFLPIIKIINP